MLVVIIYKRINDEDSVGQKLINIMTRFLFIVPFLLLAGCMSADHEQAAIKAARLWNAQKYSVGKGVSTNTDNDSKKSLTLTLEDLKGVEANYSMENITSISAITFLQNLKEVDYDGYSFIKITLKNNGSTFEKEYKISDLKLTKEHFGIVDNFFKMVKALDFKGFSSLFDKKAIPDSTITKLQEGFVGMSTDIGKFDKIVVTGFQFNTLANSKAPVIIIYADFSNAKTFVNTNFIINIVDKKINHFGINE